MGPSGALEHVEDEAFVIVKAAPRVSQQYGATVCCAAIDRNGCWVRLYPVSFRYLDQRQQFRRWDRIRYRWRRPRATADQRGESRRVDDKSIEIVGALPKAERSELLHRTAVTSLKAERAAGRSLALLQMEFVRFDIVRRSAEEVGRELANRKAIREQGDMFQLSENVSADASPYAFKYTYRDDDGEHTGTCQDWETEATFLRRRHEFGSEAQALDWMQHKFGVDLPQRGIMLAMRTHRRWPDQWLINGVIQVGAEPSPQRLLF